MKVVSIAALAFSVATTCWAKGNKDEKVLKLCRGQNEESLDFLRRANIHPHYSQLTQEGELHHYVIYTSKSKDRFFYGLSADKLQAAGESFQTTEGRGSRRTKSRKTNPLSDKLESTLAGVANKNKDGSRFQKFTKAVQSRIQNDPLEQGFDRAMRRTFKRLAWYMSEAESKLTTDPLSYNVCLAVNTLPSTEISIENQELNFSFHQQPNEYRLVLKTSFYSPTEQNIADAPEEDFIPVGDCHVIQTLLIYRSSEEAEFTGSYPMILENEERIRGMLLPKCRFGV